MAYEEAQRRIAAAKAAGARELDLAGLDLEELPPELWELVGLEVLVLGKFVNGQGYTGNKLSQLPPEIVQLTNLQQLDLRYNHLSILPPEVCQLVSLQKLRLTGNHLRTLPPEIKQLKSLEVIDLGFNQVINLPPEIGQLINLCVLDLKNNQLSSLPEEIIHLIHLQRLYLSCNCFKRLPLEISQLTTLQQLNLRDSQLSSLPPEIGQLINLQQLNLRDNQLSSLPPEIGQLINLQQLYLWNNQLSSLPPEIGQLINLKKLGLSYNEISKLPAEIIQLTNLEQLDLSFNQLSSLPAEIGRLKNLKEFDLIGNDLNSLPPEIGQLTNLQHLYVCDNQLTDLPLDLGYLTALQTLDLSGNPLNLELSAINDAGLWEIQNYLQAKAQASITVNQAKLILLGEGEVGKSCLLGALRNDPWVENRPTTHGIEIKPVTLTPIDQPAITLNGWDFGGQRVYRPTHQLFFSDPAIYLVIWKPREGPQQGFVKEWITLIKHREPEAQILIVATHGGPAQRQPDIDRQELLDQFGESIRGFFFVDSKPDENGHCKGIDELKAKITEVAANLAGMGRTIPAAWQQIWEALQATQKPYLSYTDVLEICHNQGVNNLLSDLCLQVYHKLGTLIYYHQDSLLQDIVILKPDWLAKAISFILDDAETRQRNGLASFSHLSQIWSNPPFENETGYPKALHPLFLKLMERFDLSYRVILNPHNPTTDISQSTSLIAQLVPDNRPDNLSNYWPQTLKPGEQQKIQVCRIIDAKDQLAPAEGLFYQLIVRLHQYSLGRDDYRNSIHWQRGLILEDGFNGRAFLEHIGTNIKITVRAVYPENFISRLTSDVKLLVETFWEGLKCQIVVPCIEPCGLNQPGRGEFEISKLIASKEKGRPEYPCAASGCDQWQNIDALMQNVTVALPQDVQILADLQSQIRAIRQDIHIGDRRNQERFKHLSQNQQKILSQGERQYNELMQWLADEAKNGPRLFSFKPVTPGFFDKPRWVSWKFEITLWCEHAHQPLPFLNPNEPKKGVYELELSREWVSKAAPYLKLMSTCLGLVLPVAGAAAKVTLNAALTENLEKQIELTQETANLALQGSNMATDWLNPENSLAEWSRDRAESDGDLIRAQGYVLQQFHQFFQQQDPTFGGLIRVQNKRYEFLWVHEQFVDQY